MKDYNKGFRKIMLIISLLALNIVEQAASVISSTIPQMAQAFPEQSPVQIELVTTVVSVFVTIFVLISGFITNKIGQKNTAILGIAIAAVSSIIPAFSNNFQMIMVSRAVLGIGIGLANPLAVSLIGEFFEGDLLANLMGWRTAVAGIGTSLMTVAAGQLLKISWHASYLVYLLFIPTLLFFIFFVPSPEKNGIQHEEINNNNVTDEVDAKGARIKVLGYALLLFGYFACVMVSMVKLATMYVENGIGTPSQASTVFAVLNFAQLLGGFGFGTAYKNLNSKILPFGLLLSGLSMIGMSQVGNNGAILLFAIISGVAGGMSIPYIFTRISQLSITKTAPLNSALALVGSNMGSFISPYLASILGSSAAVAISHAGILLIVISLVVIVSFVFQEKQAYVEVKNK
ncbi:Predicted arabinose efflux permease, MFS family [Streptococcus gallolyticus]|uniref:Predicted arabinose efflux permease, MFS family n=1 Tax=Streptococcus gallolyticus TaxID=315405 RepID=A0A1H7UQN8_9STRE|nr:MFS transporter [Streptococcus gallolyticus]SEF19085.1 Predicted arabinose efflux permease, MFS family [Streptococcus gallolyticus]SEL99116.1 Predicted arabinose efflux permease, MFS family [Streptococcus gallolyticus]